MSLLSRGSHLVTRCFARYALRKYGRGGEESCGTKCDDRCLHFSSPETRAVPPSWILQRWRWRSWPLCVIAAQPNKGMGECPASPQALTSLLSWRGVFCRRRHGRHISIFDCYLRTPTGALARGYNPYSTIRHLNSRQDDI